MSIERVRVNEGSSKLISFTLTDSTGVAVPLVDIDTAQLTYYDFDTYSNTSPALAIINSRDSQDILNASNVTIATTSGLVTWSLQPLDAVIMTEHRQIERHRALFRFVVGTATLDYEIELEVVNLRSAA